jgi:hypothetical protein
VRRAALLVISLALLAPAQSQGQPPLSRGFSVERHLQRNPYDYAARKDLAAAHRQARDYSSAYYHAAWLTWLASRQYADSEFGTSFLTNRGVRDRAARGTGSGPVRAAIAAIDAKHLIRSTCLNGAIAQQAPRLRGEVAHLLARAEEAQAGSGKNDPVARMATAHLALALDDALRFQGGAEAPRQRLLILRKAASCAAAAAAWVPECPGPHRLLAVTRARMAEIERDSQFWDLSIAAGERAYELDPDDTELPELLWMLHLRAGHWEEAKRWQARVEAAAASCPPD